MREYWSCHPHSDLQYVYWRENVWFSSAGAETCQKAYAGPNHSAPVLRCGLGKMRIICSLTCASTNVEVNDRTPLMPFQGGCDEPARANFRTGGCDSKMASRPLDQPCDSGADCAGSFELITGKFLQILLTAPIQPRVCRRHTTP